MKPVNKEKYLRSQGKNDLENKSSNIKVHKPQTNKTKKNNKNPKKNKSKNDANTKVIKGGAAAAAGLALIGSAGYIMTHNGTTEPLNSEKAKDSSENNDFESNNNSKSTKSQNKKDKKKNKEDKGSKTLNSLLTSMNDKNNESNNKKSQNNSLDDLINVSNKNNAKKISDNSLDELSKLADKSKNFAEKIGNSKDEEEPKITKDDNQPKPIPLVDKTNDKNPNSDKPTNSNQPVTPITPEKPDNLDKPVNPDNPDKPVNPDNPDKPVNPDNPDKPVNPDNPDKPVNPDNPDKPVNPDNPDKPVNPDNPDKPVNPDNPDKPVNPDNPDKPVNPDNPDKPVNPDNPDKPVNPDNPTEVPADKIPNGSSKTVNLVTKDGQEVGTATLTKNNNQVSISNIPSGYEVKDTNQLLQWPDKVVVESNGTSKPEVPADKIPNGSSKTVNLVTKDGQEVGTATLTKTNNQVNISNIPSGYEVKDTSQLLQWPDKVVVESNGTSKPEVPADKIPNGSSKTVNLVTKDGQEVGTATLTKTNNQVNISNIPSGYEVKDTSQLLQWPDKVVVESNGTSKPEVPADKIPNGLSKTVNLVTKDGQEVGTATLTRNNNQVSISNIPSGYEVKDTSQLLQWPDKVVVESNGTSNTEVPVNKIPNGSSKTVNLVTKDGQEVGTATLAKVNNQVNISNIPSDYEVVDTTQLLQWPEIVVVVKITQV